MRIEIVRPGNASAAAALVRDVSRETYQSSGRQVRLWAEAMARVEVWQERIERPGSMVLAASDAGVVVGVVWVACLESPGPYDTDGYLGGLYVAAPGRGIGGSLVRRAEQQAARWRRRALLAEALYGGPGHRMLCHLGWRERGNQAGRIVDGEVWAELVRDLEGPRADHGA
jgi:GNAT superfamily N-acetyltransferase